MIKAVIELELTPPYKKSIMKLSEFCHLRSCGLLEGGTYRAKATISMSSGSFKKIFGTNPSIGEYNVPKGTEHFTRKWIVKEVNIKE